MRFTTLIVLSIAAHRFGLFTLKNYLLSALIGKYLEDMIKSFQGERKKKEKSLSAKSISVSECMTTNLITFKPDQSIDEVIQKMLTSRISGGPVVNDANELVGIISEGDCLKETVKGKYHNMPTLSSKVEDYMTKSVIHVSHDLDVFEAADKFLELKIRRFPVLKDGQLVGQISQRDVIKAILEIKGETWGK